MPNWLTGTGTLALAGTTVWLTKRESGDRRELQKEARDREAAKRREQAGLIAAWHAGVEWHEASDASEERPPPSSVLALSNRSDEPVYEVVASLVVRPGGITPFPTGEELMRNSIGVVAGSVRYLALLPPGLWKVAVDAGWGGMHRSPGAEIGFTDRAGVHWIRRANGTLEEIRTKAPEHYGLPQPFGVWNPEPFGE